MANKFKYIDTEKMTKNVNCLIQYPFQNKKYISIL